MGVISLLAGVMMRALCVLSLFLCQVLAQEADTQAPQASQRQKKQFFVSTTTSSTTLTTQSLCYVKFQAASYMSVCAIASGRRRKRSFLEAGVVLHDEEIGASPMMRGEPSDEALANENVAIESGQEGLLERNKRFLNYWLTITKTTTLTSYTTTSSIGSLICTPYGFAPGPCAGN